MTAGTIGAPGSLINASDIPPAGGGLHDTAAPALAPLQAPGLAA